MRSSCSILPLWLSLALTLAACGGGGPSPPPNQPPTITSANTTTFTVGTAGLFRVTATGVPAPTLSETGPLPNGVTFDPTTGALGGVPGAGTGGTYNLTFAASNGVLPSATQTFTLTVDQTPAITSANTTTFTVGTAGSFTVTATGFPAPTLSQTGTLPSGVTFDASTGVLSGTPAAGVAGTYPTTITASNGIGTNATQSFNLLVDNPAPVLYSVSPTAAIAGDPDTALTVGGSDFTGQSVVYYNATALATTYGSATQLTATIPSSLLPPAGSTTTAVTETITVTNPGPGGGASTSLTFTIWPSYPRTNAGSVLAGPPPSLKQIPLNGTEVSVLDWTSKDSDGDALDVLAADHLVTELGIPNTDTTDFATAAANPFLAVAGTLDLSWALSTSEISEITNYVQNGGTLYLWEPTVSPLLSALGIGGFTSYSGTYQRQLTFDVSQTDPILKYIDATQETNWGPYFPSAVSTIGYSAGSCTPLATWTASGDFALLRCDIGSGRAYVFGWSLRVLLALPEHQWGNVTGPQGLWPIVPDADVCRMLMHGSYEGFASNPQERQWAPGGHQAALIITHDVGARVAYENVPAWVDLEDSLGIKATYNFVTSPYDNGWISNQYDGPGHESIVYALAHGMDVESHSFGHFPDFENAPYSLTTPPSESASNYEPMFVQSATDPRCCTTGMSVIGEVGVSRWLLDNDFGINVTAFRAGYTVIPPTLLQGLAAAGYMRDQSYLLDLTRGSFPFVLWDTDTSTTPETVITYPVVEYPMAISGDGIDSTNIAEYVQQWETVIKFNYAFNAPTVMLLHPVDTTVRFEAVQQLLSDLQNQGYDLWVGDLTTFAKFWEGQGMTDARWP